MASSRFVDIFCKCGHQVPAYSVLRKLGQVMPGDTVYIQAVQPLLPRLRCASCGVRGAAQAIIVEKWRASSAIFGAPLPARPVQRTPAKPTGRHVSRGNCRICGEQIPDQRLKALPTASTCFYCAEKHSPKAKRLIAAPWGSRASQKRDRASCRRR